MQCVSSEEVGGGRGKTSRRLLRKKRRLKYLPFATSGEALTLAKLAKLAAPLEALKSL